MAFFIAGPPISVQVGIILTQNQIFTAEPQRTPRNIFRLGEPEFAIDIKMESGVYGFGLRSDSIRKAKG